MLKKALIVAGLMGAVAGAAYAVANNSTATTGTAPSAAVAPAPVADERDCSFSK